MVVMTVRSERGLEAEARRANTSIRVLEHKECGCGGGDKGACPGPGCDTDQGENIGCPASWAHTLHLVVFTALGIIRQIFTFQSLILYLSGVVIALVLILLYFSCYYWKKVHRFKQNP